MTYKSATRPLCRCCGRPIAKRTAKYWLREKKNEKNHPMASRSSGDIFVERFPTSIEEAQRLVNEKIVSVSRWGHPEVHDGETHIDRFSTWDGESWEDEFFCNGTCARQFAYAMAREFPTYGLPAWHAARKKTA